MHGNYGYINHWKRPPWAWILYRGFPHFQHIAASILQRCTGTFHSPCICEILSVSPRFCWRFNSFEMLCKVRVCQSARRHIWRQTSLLLCLPMPYVRQSFPVLSFQIPSLTVVLSVTSRTHSDLHCRLTVHYTTLHYTTVQYSTKDGTTVTRDSAAPKLSLT